MPNATPMITKQKLLSVFNTNYKLYFSTKSLKKTLHKGTMVMHRNEDKDNSMECTKYQIPIEHFTLNTVYVYTLCF